MSNQRRLAQLFLLHLGYDKKGFEEGEAFGNEADAEHSKLNNITTDDDVPSD